MTTSATTTATVETLTAEVRVLAVGNRQITLSVAKQLDFVELENLTVFGRVKLGGTSSEDLVIGADTLGNLSLARYSTYRKPYQWAAFLQMDSDWSPDELPEVGWALKTDRDGCYRLQFGSGDSSLPIQIVSSECRKREGEEKFRDAQNEWIRLRSSWWNKYRSEEGFDLPKPDLEDFGAYGWNPGPHWAELELDARAQLAECERRHRLYEAAKSAPLIVLAGLK